MSMHISFVIVHFPRRQLHSKTAPQNMRQSEHPEDAIVASQSRPRGFDGASSAATIEAVEYNKPRAGLSVTRLRNQTRIRAPRRIVASAAAPERPESGAAALVRAPAAIVAN